MGKMRKLVHICVHSITGATGLNSKKPDQLYYILVYITRICVHYTPLLGGGTPTGVGVRLSVFRTIYISPIIRVYTQVYTPLFTLCMYTRYIHSLNAPKQTIPC